MRKHPKLSILLRILALGTLAASLFLFAQLERESTLSIRIVDARTGAPTAARVTLQDLRGTKPHVRGALAVSDSALPIPKAAIAVLWGQQDRAEGYALQPDGSFYVDGGFETRLPPGAYTLTVAKGFEYVRQEIRIEAKAGAAESRDVRLERWADLPSRGWYSSDDHIHLRRSPGDDRAILRWIAAEDIHVGNLLQMGDFWATYFGQYGFGEPGRYQESDRVLSAGQEEPRTPEIGHTISLGAREFVRMSRDYYSYDRLFDRVHELGGVTGFAHQGMSFHGYRGMTLNILRGKVDFLELAQFCVPEGPLPLEHYYRFLNLGYRLTALAGSDFPWCGPKFAQIGNARFYAYAGAAFSYEKWFAAVQAGRTFVTTGPMLFLTVDGKPPGETITATPGTRLHISAEALGQRLQTPLRALEIVAEGKVVARSQPGNPDRLTVDLDLPVEHGLWIAARCEAAPGQVAHTSPVYVNFNGQGWADADGLSANLGVAEGYLREIEEELAHPGTALDSQAGRHRAQLERQIAEARGKLKGLAAR